jgi:pyruvate/2-oxoglutarate dehydrogenase complex dihydrolipoamide acyltransferase (E2) component
VTVELEAIDAGTLVEIVAEAGTEVAVGDPIGWLDDGA